MRPLRFLYLGLPIGGLALTGDGHEIVAACISRPSYPGMRRLRARLAALGAPVFARPDLDDTELQRILRAAKPDLVVSFFWHTKVPSAVRAIAALGAIGVHPSLLPRHRGPDPIFWTIRRGDSTTGVTVHALDEGYDTGPVLAAREVDVPPGVNALRLAHMLDRPALALLREVCLSFALDASPAGQPQDESLATGAPEPSEDDLEIRWSWQSAEILRLVRAAAPSPGAFSSFGDHTITVEGASGTAHRLEPGVAVLLDQGVVVGTSDCAVRLEAVRIDDGDELLRGEAIGRALEGVSDLRGKR
ncbi:MAG: methionyl-tRNA formyltransferase [Deltaproteobacteria bacterium]|nr:methionyl-tRNA formyltransferase [Deltaproteobacteria bacterium]